MQKLREDREIIIPKESLALHDTGASEINPVYFCFNAEYFSEIVYHMPFKIVTI